MRTRLTALMRDYERRGPVRSILVIAMVYSVISGRQGIKLSDQHTRLPLPVSVS